MVEYSVACSWCPRRCSANRMAGQLGMCGCANELVVARAALHHWEEPPISGTAGSGTVFFSGCSLGCVYCQNAPISSGVVGKTISLERLVEIFFELEAQGALNINLVTASHYWPIVGEALRIAKSQGLKLPIVYNTSGYETERAIQGLSDVVDVWLTDFKYADAKLAARYSNAPDYPILARIALELMAEGWGKPEYDTYNGDTRLTRGIIVRHLLLPGPGALDNSKAVIDLLASQFKDQVLVSLMNQFTVLGPDTVPDPSTVLGPDTVPDPSTVLGPDTVPVDAHSPQADTVPGDAHNPQACILQNRFPELLTPVSADDYEALLDYADEAGLEDYFWQDGPAASDSFIPLFDFTGVEKSAHCDGGPAISINPASDPAISTNPASDLAISINPASDLAISINPASDPASGSAISTDQKESSCR